MNSIKITSWNICLGISNKLNFIKNLLYTENIDVLFIQEAELQNQTRGCFYKIDGYSLIISETIISGKARLCCYIKNSIKFSQNKLKNNTIELISIAVGNLTINGIYRPFKIPHHNNHHEYMTELTNELNTIKKTKYTILLGDFNLDSAKKSTQNYNQHHIYEILNEYLDNCNLIQMETKSTWSRCREGKLIESTLDHIYLNDPTIIKNYTNTKQVISDHNTISVTLGLNYEKNISNKKISIMDWSKYDPEVMKTNLLNILPQNMDTLNAQDHLSQLNQILGTLLDEQVKTIKVKRKHIGDYLSIKMIKLRKQRAELYRRMKKNGSKTLQDRIGRLDKIIKKELLDEAKKKIRNSIRPGDPRTLWKAVKLAKGDGFEELPDTMMMEGVLASTDEDKADLFKSFFNNKVTKIVDELLVTDELIGQKLIEDINGFDLMVTEEDILKILSDTTPKNSSGYDRIPMRMLVDCKEVIMSNVCSLINKIFRDQTIPDQWKVSKVLPLHKNGEKNNIENYRPISNICSLAKIFERCVLLKLSQLEDINGVDLTGSKQHGFKKNHSTVTAMMEIQDRISEAVDNGKNAAMISIDLSAAFDVVNHKRLFKTLQKIGIPNELVMVLQNWLTGRRFYTEVNGICSVFSKIFCGTLQGSVLGPVLFALFISPIYDVCEMFTYADDNYIIDSDVDLDRALTKVKMKAEQAIRWLKNAGMKVNTSKTELCIFSRKDIQQKTINLFDEQIVSKSTIKVLGVIFDTKLTWYTQTINQLNSCKSILFGLKTVRRYFTNEEFLQIINAFFYSKLYYACQIWLIPSLSAILKRKLFSCSSRALRMIAGDDYDLFSFSELHCLFNRASPLEWSNYSNACTLYSVIQTKKPEMMWLKLQENFQINNRTDFFTFKKTNRTKIGLNSFINRIDFLTRQLCFNDFNLSKSTFKIKCKELFL